MFGYSNGTKYDLSYFFAPKPIITSSTVTISGSPTLSGFTNANITATSYNNINVTSGTLYRFTSNGSITLTSGSLKCYAVLIGPGGYGTNRTAPICAGAGGAGILGYFDLTINKTYNITINNGTNGSGTGSRGTTVQGNVTIVSSDSPTTVNLLANGANTTTNYSATDGTLGGTATVNGSGVISYQSYSGGNGNYTNKLNGVTSSNGESGYTFTSTGNGMNIPNSPIFSDISNLIGTSNSSAFGNSVAPSGFTTFGFGSGGAAATGASLGGGGGNYNRGGTVGTGGAAGNNAIGYGCGGGYPGSNSNIGGTGGAGAVFIYLSPNN